VRAPKLVRREASAHASREGRPLAMRTVLPTSLSSRSLSACHSTTQSAPA
jgi:hypothetical protein